ncbi:MAG: FtsH protease activity modulator HflK [Rhodocyclaceae bacterium]|nr:FtsH protease activity modulator HflK [Rhodocyclaceae bacterium]MBK6906713.1 FtsH protease activity modulator HflK [Rhodocyclaceae bacterium]
MSMNDHGWGNSPNGGNKGKGDGPPDLEEIWRDFNRRLSGLFGKRGGEPSPVSPIRPGQIGGGFAAIAGLAAVLWLSSGYYIVDASERGVVLQFGRYSETTEPGLRWRFPWPVESHEIVNLTGVRTVEVGYRGSEKNRVPREALMLTDDENIVSVQFAVQYLIKDPKNYLFAQRHPDDSVIQAAETSIREVVGKSRMDFVLYESRDQIAASTQKLIQDILDRYDTGIQIRSVNMQSAQPPEQVQSAFDDAVKAGQDKERQKNEGQAYANDVVPKAQGTASRLLQEADGYKQRMIATAEGDASRFKQILAEYSRAPEVTRQRMYLETMQQVYSNTSKVMVDAKGQGNLLYLPLDKLMQVTAPLVVSDTNTAPPAGIAPSINPVTSAPQQTVPDRGSPLDRPDAKAASLRSRERGDR